MEDFKRCRGRDNSFLQVWKLLNLQTVILYLIPIDFFQEVWRFNVLTDCWELMDIPVDDFPEELASFASIV